MKEIIKTLKSKNIGAGYLYSYIHLITEIASFYMLEKYRNKGYGKQTIEYLKKELLPKRIRLWVLKDNAKAIKFYETNGFAFSGNTRLIDRGLSYVQLQYECIYDTWKFQ